MGGIFPEGETWSFFWSDLHVCRGVQRCRCPRVPRKNIKVAIIGRAVIMLFPNLYCQTSLTCFILSSRSDLTWKVFLLFIQGICWSCLGCTPGLAAHQKSFLPWGQTSLCVLLLPFCPEYIYLLNKGLSWDLGSQLNKVCSEGRPTVTSAALVWTLVSLGGQWILQTQIISQIA